MLDVISDFAVLLFIVGIALAILGWRMDWFGPAAPKDIVAKATLPDTEADAPSDRAAGKDADGLPRTAPWWSLRRPAQADGDTNATDTAPDDEDLVAVHPAIADAARRAALRDARAYSQFWPADVIKSRPGWMVFALDDFLGDPATSFDYAIPGTDQTGRIPLYPIASVRVVEREDRLVSASRRKVIQSRWNARRAARRRSAAE